MHLGSIVSLRQADVCCRISQETDVHVPQGGEKVQNLEKELFLLRTTVTLINQTNLCHLRQPPFFWECQMEDVFPRWIGILPGQVHVGHVQHAHDVQLVSKGRQQG